MDSDLTKRQQQGSDPNRRSPAERLREMYPNMTPEMLFSLMAGHLQQTPAGSMEELEAAAEAAMATAVATAEAVPEQCLAHTAQGSAPPRDAQESALHSDTDSEEDPHDAFLRRNLREAQARTAVVTAAANVLTAHTAGSSQGASSSDNTYASAVGRGNPYNTGQQLRTRLISIPNQELLEELIRDAERAHTARATPGSTFNEAEFVREVMARAGADIPLPRDVRLRGFLQREVDRRREIRDPLTPPWLRPAPE